MQTQLKERPIIFSGEMVRAILDGRKTQTRRVVKDQPEESGVAVTQDKHSPSIWHLHRRGGSPIDGHIAELKCPYEPGMRLWVREKFFYEDAEYDPSLHSSNPIYPEILTYAADCEEQEGVKWRPSIHMPRWASRITLEVTDVRCERVQSISEGDAVAEGIYSTVIAAPSPLHTVTRFVAPGVKMTNIYGDVDYHAPAHSSAADGFSALWDSINASRGYSWESNPLVWAVSFKRLENSNV